MPFPTTLPYFNPFSDFLKVISRYSRKRGS